MNTLTNRLNEAVPTIYVLSKNKKTVTIFHLNSVNYTTVKIMCLHSSVNDSCKYQIFIGGNSVIHYHFRYLHDM